MYSSYRHQAMLWLIAITLAIMILSGPLWKYWSILPFSLTVLWMCDAMFMGRNSFMMEPNYNYWREANEVDY